MTVTCNNVTADYILSSSELQGVGAATEKGRVPAFVLTLGTVK